MIGVFVGGVVDFEEVGEGVGGNTRDLAGKGGGGRTGLEAPGVGVRLGGGGGSLGFRSNAETLELTSFGSYIFLEGVADDKTPDKSFSPKMSLAAAKGSVFCFFGILKEASNKTAYSFIFSADISLFPAQILRRPFPRE